MITYIITCNSPKSFDGHKAKKNAYRLPVDLRQPNNTVCSCNRQASVVKFNYFDLTRKMNTHQNVHDVILLHDACSDISNSRNYRGNSIKKIDAKISTLSLTWWAGQHPRALTSVSAMVTTCSYNKRGFFRTH